MYIRKGDKKTPARTHRMIEVKTGEILGKVSGGGGGVGDPFKRDPSAVLKDVINDFVTLEGARNTYGVVIDTDTMTVDEEATDALRASA
jgi:N-methylhydantoinase B